MSDLYLFKMELQLCTQNKTWCFEPHFYLANNVSRENKVNF